jgi:hypothetical protein
MFYAAFAVHHLRNAKFVDLDCCRVIQCLSSLLCWIDNPRTQPSVQDVTQITQTCFGDENSTEISRSVASGVVPVRAFAFALLDVEFSLSRKLFVLQRECSLRSLRIHFEDIEVRLTWLRSLVETLSQTKLDSGSSGSSGKAEIPTAFFEVAEQIAAAVKTKTMAAFVAKHLDVLFDALMELFLDR